ncbi:uncharacterized protein [Miscanthus floridulus]|uniref:uncharacterized protein isoform X1 n=1 Tax=Miscanthus floridulus TaxID=154761 RepID=UPI00345A2BB9
MNVNITKQIWDTLHLAHEGVDKVRKAKIDLLMAKLNRFVIIDGEGPQEMFDRLMTLVGKIRGYGCDELDDHKVVKVMLEAYLPRNEIVVTLIRDKKKFEHFTPNDVLGRLLTFDMQREEANERRRLGELQAKLKGMKIKEVALKANKSSNQGTFNKAKGSKQALTSQPKEIKSTPQNDDPSLSSSEDEDDGVDYMKIDDMALFMKSYHKGLKRNGYKIVKRRFPNKKKRNCYNCGSTEHFIAKCPYEKKDNKYKDNNEGKHEHKKRYKQMGEAHIRHEWDSTKETSDEGVKVATVAIQKPSSTPRLFNNMSDDDDHHSTHICLMAKGEKVKQRAKSPPPPSDISSSELSDSSDDETSDVEKYAKLTKNLDSKTKLFIINLMEELESVKAKLADRDENLEETEKMYIGCKKPLELEISEVDSLNKALAKKTKRTWSHKEGKYCTQ